MNTQTHSRPTRFILAPKELPLSGTNVRVSILATSIIHGKSPRGCWREGKARWVGRTTHRPSPSAGGGETPTGLLVARSERTSS